MFVLRVEFLTGRCVAKETHVLAEWPPHPARLFSALVSALYARVPKGENPEVAERQALEWLQQQGAPEIAFSPDVLRRAVVTQYVPVNDVSLRAKTAQKLEEDLQAALRVKTKKRESKIAAARKALREAGTDALNFLPERQSGRKPRTFPTVCPSDSVVHYIWPGSDAAIHSEALTNILGRLAYLGHSSSLVSIGIVAGCDGGERWFPNERGEKLRSFSKQQLEVLQEVFPINERAEQSYRLPYEAVSYGPRPKPVAEFKLAFSRDWVVFRKLSGPELSIRASLDVARALRRLAVNRPRSTALSERANQLLSGHAADGTPFQDDHVAWVPLSFVGRRNARGLGLLKGIAVVLPSLLDEADQAETADEILASLDVGWRLPIAGIGEWQIERVRTGEHSATLDAETWTRASTRWATVTPLMLDRHPGHLFGRAAKTEAQVQAREKSRLEAEACVADACARIGMPKPVEITVSRFSSVTGAPPSHDYRPPPHRPGKPRRYYVHATLVFDEAVPGPVLLGAGRYFGFGLCKPIAESE